MMCHDLESRRKTSEGSFWLAWFFWGNVFFGHESILSQYEQDTMPT